MTTTYVLAKGVTWPPSAELEHRLAHLSNEDRARSELAVSMYFETYLAYCARMDPADAEEMANATYRRYIAGTHQPGLIYAMIAEAKTVAITTP